MASQQSQIWPAKTNSRFPCRSTASSSTVIRVPAGSPPSVIEAAALADEKIKARTAGKTVVKVIVVPGKTVNLVVR